MSHATAIFEGVSEKNHIVSTKDKLHVRSGNDNNGSFCWGNLREHEIGEGDGFDGELRFGDGLLRRHRPDDPQAPDNDRRSNAQI